MITNTLSLKVGLAAGDKFPKKLIRGNNGDNARVANWCHDQYLGLFGYQPSAGVDLSALGIEVKTKAIDSKNSPWTIGSITTSDLLSLPLKHTHLIHKLQKILLIKFCKDTYTIISVDLVDLSPNAIQKEICQYAELARIDLMKQLNNGTVKRYQQAGCTDIHFERKAAQEQWALRITQPKLKKLIGKANLCSNSLFEIF